MAFCKTIQPQFSSSPVQFAAEFRTSFSSSLPCALLKTRALHEVSDHSRWAGLSKKKSMEITKVLDELSSIEKEAKAAQEKAEIKLGNAKSELKLKEEILLIQKEWSDFQLQVFRESLEIRVHALMEKKTRVMVKAKVLSLRWIIGKATRELAKDDEPSLPRTERWIGIFRRNPSFFKKLKRCNQNWKDEADVAAAVAYIYDRTSDFKHSFHEVNNLIHMDLPEDIATMENKCLACGIAEEAWCVIGFSTACEIEESAEEPDEPAEEVDGSAEEVDETAEKVDETAEEVDETAEEVDETAKEVDESAEEKRVR